MKKIKLIVALTTLFTLTLSTAAFALGVYDISPGENILSQNIERVKYPDGTLKDISYIISSTGATSDTRYRTSAITVNVGGQTAVINVTGLGIKPSPGEVQYTKITIAQQDILNALPNPADPAVIKALNNPDSIQVGAHIQIYNAGTGEVLATITRKNDVQSIASGYYFGQKDITQMESRFVNDSRPVIIEDKPEGDGSGVRPSILVK